MKLTWYGIGTIIARFDTCFEDENDMEEDNPEHEEFTSFVFEVIYIFGKPPVLVTGDIFFCVNYHNFPDEIIVDNYKIS